MATFNLLHGIDIRTRAADLGAAAEAIAALDADAVALQEVDRGLTRSGGDDQVAVLAERLGCHGVFAPALLGDPDVSWTAVPAGGDPGGPAYGVGLLSRLPLDAHRAVTLPGGGDGARPPANPGATRPPSPGWDREPRTAVLARLRAGDVAVTVCSTHLSYLPWRGIAQLRTLLAEAAAAAGDGVAVLLGDLNLPAWGARLLATDGWRHAGGPPTYPAWKPRLQVDHLLTRGPVTVRSVRAADPGPSDHLPLVALLAL